VLLHAQLSLFFFSGQLSLYQRDQNESGLVPSWQKKDKVITPINCSLPTEEQLDVLAEHLVHIDEGFTLVQELGKKCEDALSNLNTIMDPLCERQSKCANRLDGMLMHLLLTSGDDHVLKAIISGKASKALVGANASALHFGDEEKLSEPMQPPNTQNAAEEVHPAPGQVQVDATEAGEPRSPAVSQPLYNPAAASPVEQPRSPAVSQPLYNPAPAHPLSNPRAAAPTPPKRTLLPQIQTNFLQAYPPASPAARPESAAQDLQSSHSVITPSAILLERATSSNLPMPTTPFEHKNLWNEDNPGGLRTVHCECSGDALLLSRCTCGAAGLPLVNGTNDSVSWTFANGHIAE
jgi:hypothetical protein